jgi:pimeloyl-ACP methyl ester carboxylesterase
MARWSAAQALKRKILRQSFAPPNDRIEMRMTASLLTAFIVLTSLVLGGCASLRAEKNAPPIGKLVEADGERIHLLDYGIANSSKPPVILIHGASVNLRDMKMALGDKLAKSYRVIVVDRPGRGYSTRPSDGWRLDRQATLIHDAVVASGVEKPIVVGQSLGGAVALAYALKYQDEMSGLVVLAAVSHEWPSDVAWYNKVSGWPIAGQLLRRLVIPIYAPFAAKSGVGRSFRPDEAPDGYYDASGLTLLFRPKDFKANAEDLRHLKPQIVAMSHDYADLKLPMAILTGADDTTVSPVLHSAALAKEVPGAYYEVIADTGHALHHSQSAKVLAAIDLVAEMAQARTLRQGAAE